MNLFDISYKLTFNLKYAGGPAPPAWIAQAMEAMRRACAKRMSTARRVLGYAMLWRCRKISPHSIGQMSPASSA